VSGPVLKYGNMLLANNIKKARGITSLYYLYRIAKKALTMDPSPIFLIIEYTHRNPDRKKNASTAKNPPGIKIAI